jgi:hypothetical protein
MIDEWFPAILRATSRFRDRVHKGNLDTNVPFRLYGHPGWNADEFIGILLDVCVYYFA